MEDLSIYNCYWAPNCTLEEVQSFLDGLNIFIRNGYTRGLIVAGDFNAKSPKWFSTFETMKGQMSGDFTASLI